MSVASKSFSYQTAVNLGHVGSCRSAGCGPERVQSFSFPNRLFKSVDTDSDEVEELSQEERTVGILLDEDVITPELLESFGSAANKIDLDSDITRKDWKVMADELRDSAQLNPEHLTKIRTFAKDVRSYHNQLHKDYRASDYTDKKINRELADVHVFLELFEETRQKYLETASQVALEALAGASFGISAAVSAYVAWAGTSGDQTRELVNHLEQLHNGTSTLLQAGNRAEPIHQEQLWQKKIQLLDEATEKALAGEPTEIDLQYYEMTNDDFVDRVIKAARAGNKVRVNIDPSRPGNDVFHGLHMDGAPKKLRALLQLAQVKDADIGISLYPVKKELGSLSYLMHRKFFRVGEKVILGGMNANNYSGENVDAGYLIEGPAARELTRVFERDLAASRGATLEEILGADNVDTLMSEDLALSATGMSHLLDGLLGPTPPNTQLLRDPTLGILRERADELGLDLDDLIALSPEALENAWSTPYKRRKALPLSAQGKQLIADLATKVTDATLDADNLKRLEKVNLPEGKVSGNTVVGIGDLPVEREALLLHAISTAEEFIYIPTFVITKPVARALAARADELKASGKKLDVRVIADTNIYPFGGTPNEHGVLPLEDAGIKVRWSLIPRSVKAHDRKIHAKQIITDKMEFVGSTNLSTAGLNKNWELSGLVMFDENDLESMAARQESVDGFLKIWNHESFVLDTRKVAEKRLEDVDTKDREMRIHEARSSSIRSLLGLVRSFELESAEMMARHAEDVVVAQRIHVLEKQGMAEGYAILRAVEERLGTEAFYAELNDLEAMTKLRSLRRYG